MSESRCQVRLRTAPKPPSFCMRSLLASPLCRMRTRAPLSRTLTPSLLSLITHRRAKSRPGVAGGREEYRRLRLAEALALRAADDLRLCNRRPQSRLRRSLRGASRQAFIAIFSERRAAPPRNGDSEGLRRCGAGGSQHLTATCGFEGETRVIRGVEWTIGGDGGCVR